MIKLLKLLKWDISSSTGRFLFIFWIIKSIPGRFGMQLRIRIINKYVGRCGDNLKVHEGVSIRHIDKLRLGKGVHIGVDNFFQAAGEIEIGDNVILGPSVKIWSTNHVFEKIDIPIKEQGYEYKKVLIGNNVWIGANVFIMPGCIIGDGVIISAGSIVGKKTIPPYSILAGNPAKKIGTRT